MTSAVAADLVRLIRVVNDAWHALRDLDADGVADPPVLAALRDLKALKQVRLLREFPELAYLVGDPDPSLPEACFSVRLHTKIHGRLDACHLPQRVAHMFLTDDEILAALDRADA